MRALAWTLLAPLLGCAGSTVGTDDSGAADDTATSGCDYPAGAVEPMAEGAVLTPYRWPEARHLDGRTGSLDLRRVHCDSDPDIDWSPFDVLAFISLPAW